MTDRTLTRRNLIRAASAAALPLAGCSARHIATPITRTQESGLVPVECRPERVIRTVAGLRPFRPSGFVVKTVQMDRKTVIHNYGHGGAGITLSWGTAQLALEEAERSGHTEFAILGCGVNGLSTARLFQRRGFTATIYSKTTPPDTTSNIAGGWWSPVTLFDPGRQSPEFSANFVRAARFSHRYYQNLINDYYGVRWFPYYSLATGPVPPATPNAPDPFPEIRQLFPDGKVLNPGEHPFPVDRVRRSWSLLIEPPIYLNALLRDYYQAGGKLVIRDFPDLASVLALREPAVVNCTGLGAKALFNDTELTPVKGQLSFLIPQPEVNYVTLGPRDLYMFPRRDGILLGGTHEEGVWDLTPDPAEAKRIVDGHTELFAKMSPPRRAT